MIFNIIDIFYRYYNILLLIIGRRDAEERIKLSEHAVFLQRKENLYFLIIPRIKKHPIVMYPRVRATNEKSTIIFKKKPITRLSKLLLLCALLHGAG